MTTKIIVKQGDITEENTDAVVNAANSRLKHAGGVAYAVVSKGGQIVQEESDRIGFVPVGSAAVTGSGKLKCRYIIHAVGPVWKGGSSNEQDLLSNAVWNSLEIADSKKMKSISFPAISSGIFGFPKKLCAETMIKAAEQYIVKKKYSSLEQIIFCNIDKHTTDIFNEVLKKGEI